MQGQAKFSRQSSQRRSGAWPFVALVLALLLNIGWMVQVDSAVVYAREEMSTTHSRDRRLTREREGSSLSTSGESKSGNGGKSKTTRVTVRTRASQR